MSELVISGLVRRRAKLAGDIENAHEALRKMVLDLESLDATILQQDAARGIRSHQILFAIVDTAVVLAPSHFARVGGQIRASNVMVNTDLGAAQAGEERLSLIGASVAV